LCSENAVEEGKNLTLAYNHHTQSHYFFCFVVGFTDSEGLDWLRALHGQFVSIFISE